MGLASSSMQQEQLDRLTLLVKIRKNQRKMGNGERNQGAVQTTTNSRCNLYSRLDEGIHSDSKHSSWNHSLFISRSLSKVPGLVGTVNHWLTWHNCSCQVILRRMSIFALTWRSESSNEKWRRWLAQKVWLLDTMWFLGSFAIIVYNIKSVSICQPQQAGRGELYRQTPRHSLMAVYGTVSV